MMEMSKTEAALERHLDARMSRRDSAEVRALAVIEKREIIAEQMIGHLQRDDGIHYYVYPVGGRYREGTRRELIAFLIRNNYA